MQKKVFFLFLCVSLAIGYPYGSFAASTSSQGVTFDITVLELHSQIKDKKAKIAGIRKQIEAFQKNIRARQQEKTSLENQIAILEDQMEQTILDIEATENEIQQLNLEIEQADLEIVDKESRIALQKKRIGEFLRTLYRERQKDYFEVLLLHERFSDFFDAVQSLELIHGELGTTLTQLKALREQLLAQKTALEAQKKQQEQLHARLLQRKEEYEEQKGAKQNLVVQSVLSSEKYQQLLSEARAEQAQIDNDIVTLERTIRERLKIFTGGAVHFIWPVDPSRGVTTRFHDPGYPFRHIFEHPGIDIRQYQGSQIKAAAAGYVARVYHEGKAYSYIMVIHDQGFATVYGHVSRVLVQQDTYVKQGQVIALSGGTPGTAGAGRLTTGPHLHLEIRLNGIPVDPLKYLP